jgi:SAM-dependent methyltransferase
VSSAPLSFTERLRPLARRLPPVLPQIAVRGVRAAAVAPGLARYVRDWRAYRRLPGAEHLTLRDSQPMLADRLPTSPFDPHYFHQDVWAARWVAEVAPARHVDVGSRVDYVGFLTSHTDVTFVDIRPLEARLDRLTAIAGSVLEMPFADRSLESVSCLHVAEHIGLGRYGDRLDPHGTRKAARELQRVVAPGGQLLFSLPVGAPRVCFNAHRIHAPAGVPALFDELELTEFASVDDRGNFARTRALDALADARYACGMFRFTRRA